MIGENPKRSLVSYAKIAVLVLTLGFPLYSQGKNPVIFIPGLSGSELRNRKVKRCHAPESSHDAMGVANEHPQVIAGSQLVVRGRLRYS